MRERGGGLGKYIICRGFFRWRVQFDLTFSLSGHLPSPLSALPLGPCSLLHNFLRLPIAASTCFRWHLFPLPLLLLQTLILILILILRHRHRHRHRHRRVLSLREWKRGHRGRGCCRCRSRSRCRSWCLLARPGFRPTLHRHLLFLLSLLLLPNALPFPRLRLFFSAKLLRLRLQPKVGVEAGMEEVADNHSDRTRPFRGPSRSRC